MIRLVVAAAGQRERTSRRMTARIRPSGSEQPWHASAGRARATLFDDRPLGSDAEVIHSVAATAGQDGERWGGAACRVEGTHGGGHEFVSRGRTLHVTP